MIPNRESHISRAYAPKISAMQYVPRLGSYCQTAYLGADSCAHGAGLYAPGMRIAARKLIVAFYDGRPDRAEGRAALEAWCHEAGVASWKTPEAVKASYRSATFLKGGRVVFNICEMCRLVARLNYAVGVVCIRFVGTPTEFDNINAETI